MKLILTTMAATVAIVLPSAAVAAPGGSGATATIQGTASAEVVAPLTITCDPMHWGQLAPTHANTTVVMPANGNPLVDNDNIVVPGARDYAEAGHCDVIGEIGLTFHVSMAASETLSNGTDQMIMTDFTLSSDLDLPPGDPWNRTLADVGGLGKNGFGVGATLHVGADQPAGLYTGKYTVNVQYN